MRTFKLAAAVLVIFGPWLSHAAVVTGTIDNWVESTPFVIGDGNNSVTLYWSINTTNRGFFYGSSQTGNSDVAFANGVTDISQIVDASAFTFTSGNIGPNCDADCSGTGVGDFIIWRNTDSGHYGVLRIDDIGTAVAGVTLRGTWWFQTNGTGDFLTDSDPGPNDPDAVIVQSTLETIAEVASTRGGDATEVDYWYFTVNAPGVIAFDVLSWLWDRDADGVANYIDSEIWLFRDDGSLDETDFIAENDDEGFFSLGTDGSVECCGEGSGYIYDSYLSLELAAGDYILAISDVELSLENALGGTNFASFTPAVSDGVVDEFNFDGCPTLDCSFGDYQITFIGDVSLRHGEVDSDSDGIDDGSDLCPDSLPGVLVDANGCAIDVAVSQIATGLFDLIDSFVSDKARDKLGKSQDKLNEALAELAEGDTKKGLKKIADGVKELLKAEKEGVDVADLIEQLLEAARSQAQAAIDAAVAAGGDPKKIAKAQEEMVKAEEELAKGKPDNAIDKYAKAWDEAEKAQQ